MDFLLYDRAAEGASSVAVDAVELDRMLREADSTWTVGVGAGGHLELQRRVPEEAAAALASAVAAADRPGVHLKSTWSEAFGRHPDATGAYRNAARAVEVAAIALVSPANSKATLGTVIAHWQRADEVRRQAGHT